MPKLIFQPGDIAVEAESNTKVLAVANRNKIAMRFGCASCRCGTCAVKVSSPQNLSAMKPDEKALLERMRLDSSGIIRLACQARIMENEVEIDLSFQDTYSPDQGDDDEDEE